MAGAGEVGLNSIKIGWITPVIKKPQTEGGEKWE